MNKVRIHDPVQLRWLLMREVVSPNLAAKLSDSELNSLLAYHERGASHSPQLSEMKYLPHAVIEVHAHSEDEIIYLLEGSIRLGSRILEPGTSVFLAAATLYGFSAGAAGARMLVFRPRGGASYLEKEEVLLERNRLSRQDTLHGVSQ